MSAKFCSGYLFRLPLPSCQHFARSDCRYYCPARLSAVRMRMFITRRERAAPNAVGLPFHLRHGRRVPDPTVLVLRCLRMPFLSRSACSHPWIPTATSSARCLIIWRAASAMKPLRLETCRELHILDRIRRASCLGMDAAMCNA